MESTYSELALYASKNLSLRSDNVFSPISEVCKGTVSLKIFATNSLEKICFCLGQHEVRFVCHSQTWKKRALRVLQNPTFFRLSAKSVLISATFLPKLTKLYQTLPKFSKFTKFYKNFTKVYQISPKFY